VLEALLFEDVILFSLSFGVFVLCFYHGVCVCTVNAYACPSCLGGEFQINWLIQKNPQKVYQL